MDKLIILAKAFSDFNRLKIVALIQRDSNLCVCEVCDTLKLSQPLVSRHLKQLVKSDILDSTRKGKWIYYKLSNNDTELFKCWLESIKQYESILPATIACDLK